MRCHLCVASSSQARADLRTPLATRRLLHMQRYCAHGLKVLSHVWRLCSEALLNRVKKYCQVIEECCRWFFMRDFFLDLFWIRGDKDVFLLFIQCGIRLTCF